MGTRNLTCVVKGGVFKVAQYGQWDGYPSGQGEIALKFLRELQSDTVPGLFDRFVSQVEACYFGTQKDWDVVNASGEYPSGKYSYMSRNTGAGILDHIFNADGPVILQDDSAFAADGLFCEWVYVVDLDRRTFEVYDGFHKTPAPDGERFAYLNKDPAIFVPEFAGQDLYQPVHLRKSYSLDDLPSVEAFLADFAEADESEGEEAAA